MMNAKKFKYSACGVRRMHFQSTGMVEHYEIQYWQVLASKAFVKGSSYCCGQRKLIQGFGDCFGSVLYGGPRVNSTRQSFHPLHRPKQWQVCTMR